MSFAELGLPQKRKKKEKRKGVIRLGDNNAEKESCLLEIFTYYKSQLTCCLLPELLGA
jgi:hypothetical protein